MYVNDEELFEGVDLGQWVFDWYRVWRVVIFGDGCILLVLFMDELMVRMCEELFG